MIHKFSVHAVDGDVPAGSGRLTAGSASLRPLAADADLGLAELRVSLGLPAGLLRSRLRGG